MATNRVRSFVFTWNNYNEQTEELLESIRGCTYLCYGREVAPTTGTRHLQGYIRFRDGKSIASVRRKLAGAHVEIARSVDAAIEYTQKDGDFVERGVRPKSDRARGEDEKARWEEAWEAAKAGRIEEIPPDIRVRCYNSIKRIQKDYMGKPQHLASPCGIWIYGESGIGKTKAVYDRFPGLYSKNASKWWDGYQNEDVVLFDDVDPEVGKWSSRYLKIWADQYHFIADTKGGSVAIRPKLVIVTSQFTIDACYPEREAQVAIKRRFRFIEFLNRGDPIDWGTYREEDEVGAEEEISDVESLQL